MLKEEWRTIPGYEGFFSVSNNGRVRRDIGGSPSTYPGKIRKQQACPRGYMKVSLWRDGAASTHRIHKLVMLAFVGAYPDGHNINHKDGNPSNNALSNLEYVTYKENSQHAVRTGLHHFRERTGNSVLTPEIVRQIRSLYQPRKMTEFTMPKLAKRFGVAYSTVKGVIYGRTWTHVQGDL